MENAPVEAMKQNVKENVSISNLQANTVENVATSVNLGRFVTVDVV